MKICSIEGCDKPFIAKGMCHMHYRRDLRRNPASKTYMVNKGINCSIAECETEAFSKGLCVKHYYQEKRLAKAQR